MLKSIEDTHTHTHTLKEKENWLLKPPPSLRNGSMPALSNLLHSLSISPSRSLLFLTFVISFPPFLYSFSPIPIALNTVLSGFVCFWTLYTWILTVSIICDFLLLFLAGFAGHGQLTSFLHTIPSFTCWLHGWQILVCRTVFYHCEQRWCERSFMAPGGQVQEFI